MIWLVQNKHNEEVKLPPVTHKHSLSTAASYDDKVLYNVYKLQHFWPHGASFGWKIASLPLLISSE